MFKKILLTYVTVNLTFGINVFAQQIKNGDFESWTPQGGSGAPTYDDPNGWGTPNILSNPIVFGSNPVSVFKATSPDVNGGTYAVKITTFHYTKGGLVGDLNPYLPNDTLGFAFKGKLQPSAPYLIPGDTMTIRYAQLDFFAKYTPVGSDQGTCSVLLKKWNGTKADTVAAGAVIINSTSSFTKYTVSLIYKPGNTVPDTAIVIFNSSYKKPQIGSALWVDDLSFSGLVGINERNMLINAIKVFPNPATNNITFAASVANESLSMVEIFDATGRRIDGVAIQNNRHELNVNKYAEGLYMYNAYNDKKELIGIGKFNVTK